MNSTASHPIAAAPERARLESTGGKRADQQARKVSQLPAYSDLLAYDIEQYEHYFEELMQPLIEVGQRQESRNTKDKEHA
ncbi:hypothetical protein HaLaN_32271, partial [Haematococcus lacustris]